MATARPPPKPTRFASAAAFRAWLERHHATKTDLLVRCYKMGGKRDGMTYPEGVDEALCFGWIDGVRRRLDAESFTVRFSPRKPKSRWSAVNVRRARALEEAGRLRPAGLTAFRARPGDSAGYSFESRPRKLPPAAEKRFRRNRTAWAFFQSQPPWYRRTSAFWVVSAKREETRERRLAILIRDSEAGRLIAPLTRT